ncbi:MAG: hypothetical protein P4L92_18090 [Rudaea sp.]|nr:hypothetical protein [Rudaea sp.]
MLCSVSAIIVYTCWDPSPRAEAFDAADALSVVAWGAFSGFCFWLLGIAGDSPVTWRTLVNGGLGDCWCHPSVAAENSSVIDNLPDPSSAPSTKIRSPAAIDAHMPEQSWESAL